ncbi:hypothetical protein V1517DRAFT_203071 [Lipomyces orientalis]|uniref:Uncharacterized protein n=1 Tax=Lipomyces orientalis TaxID=1233043 RepID=A0ACC3TVJ2_9ASCO
MCLTPIQLQDYCDLVGTKTMCLTTMSEKPTLTIITSSENIGSTTEMTTHSSIPLSILRLPGEQRPLSPAKSVHFAIAKPTVHVFEISQQELDLAKEDFPCGYSSDEESDDEDSTAEVVRRMTSKKSTARINFLTKAKRFFRRRKTCPFSDVSYKQVGLEDWTSLERAEASVSDELVKKRSSTFKRVAEFFKRRQSEKELRPAKPLTTKPPNSKKSAFDEAAVPLLKDSAPVVDDAHHRQEDPQARVDRICGTQRRPKPKRSKKSLAARTSIFDLFPELSTCLDED